MHLPHLIRDQLLPRFLMLLVLVLLCGTTEISGQDKAVDTTWMQHLGPERNGTYPSNISTKWPNRKPVQLWKRNSGSGWSSPVSNGKSVIIYHRYDDKELVESFDLLTGSPNWKKEFKATYYDSFGFDNGPRATPLWSDHSIFIISPVGFVRALNTTNGDLIWESNTESLYSADTGFFGLVCSPTLHNNKLILTIGGKSGHGVIALDSKSGKLLWKSLDDEAGYSSPTVTGINGSPTAICFNRFGLVGLKPDSGDILFRKRWRSSNSASVNAASPIIIEDKIFVTSSYNTGALLSKWDGKDLTTQWSNDESLSSHYTTPVFVDGFIYGVDGRVDFPGDLSLRCVNFTTGNVEWSRKWRTGASLIAAANSMLIQMDDGELVQAQVSQSGMKLLNRGQVNSGICRAIPALVKGIYLTKSDKSLVAIDLRPSFK